MMARERAESNEEEDVEAGRVNAKKPASSECKLEDAVQRAMNDLEQERKKSERPGPHSAASRAQRKPLITR